MFTSLKLNSCFSVSTGQWYGQLSPQSWTTANVLDWISDQVESTKYDASTLSLAYCTMDGSDLCQMTRDQMIGVFGPQLGPHLYQSLQEHKSKYGKNLHLLCGQMQQTKNNLYTIFLCIFLRAKIKLAGFLFCFFCVKVNEEKRLSQKSFPDLHSLSDPELHETCQLLDNFLDNLNFPLLSTIRIGQGTLRPRHWDGSYCHKADTF